MACRRGRGRIESGAGWYDGRDAVVFRVVYFFTMEKNFDTWNEQKKRLETVQKQTLFKEGDIWWCSLGINVQTELCGKGRNFRRPVLVVKKLSKFSCIVVPVSTKKNEGTWFCPITILGGVQYVSLHQIQMIHVSRLQRRMVTLDEADFVRVKKSLENLLNLSDCKT
jgi:mRNA interferase MazF